MVLTAQEDTAACDRPDLRNDILWDEEPEQSETSLPSDLAPLGSGADDRLALTGTATK